ncbi:DUF6011 domain-containing protein [Amycolatopsis pithecellobii]|uniref:Uncharacterized protein n=1 Tax=Amycolatopsis pithecellobii TaxID=664692 RepID=A0A6N7Z3I7_9PSEU|nr:DUF6011 domain-containing protein [Amycolatopsis pithecellobii]MTD55699.1 hypothetical protein [Amycolatopsis pithecellobii]
MTNLPHGYWAIPIHDEYSGYDVEDPRFCELVGHYLVRVTKRGKLTPAAKPMDGIDWPRFDAVLANEREYLPFQYYLEYLTDDELGPWYRENYGKLTGHCGWCGKALTDPDSKLRGIGPECARGIREARLKGAR